MASVEEAVLDAMGRRLAALPGKPHESEPYTIFRVAGAMRERNRHLYEPQMVSIGPFHRGAARLRALEEHKWRYLRDLLARNPDAALRDCVRAAHALEPLARRCYSESVALASADFVEMLLLDGAFLLEYFLKGEEPDALCDVGWGLPTIFSDLLLLENQIPFVVVEHLYAIITGGLGRDYLISNVLAGLLADNPQPGAFRVPEGDIHHLLHLQYHFFVPDAVEERADEPEAKAEERQPGAGPWLLPCASQLREAGVTFRAKREASDMFDVAFRSGVMEIPAVERHINRAMFANLLAHEQSRGFRLGTQRLTSYVTLMAALVDTQRDVEILQRAGVFMKGDDETAMFYNHLGELCPLLGDEINCYAAVFGDVKRYCNKSWNRHRSVLVHDYFASPWAALSLAAAALLLLLSVLQTVYTIVPYYFPHSS